jgi:phage terminase large subunit-like protein
MGLTGSHALTEYFRPEVIPDVTKIWPWEKPGLSRTKRVISFLEHLPITKGKLEGTSMRLLPNQREFVKTLYGPKTDSIKLAVLSEPRGNGKTGLIAGLMLCHLIGPEAEPRGACYSAAIDRAQAALIFTEMTAIIDRVPEWRVMINIKRFHRTMEVRFGPAQGSTYEAMSADDRRGHGLAPSFWAYDELAQAKNRRLLDNLTTAMGKRERSLGIILSTQAASDNHPLSELIDAGLNKIDDSIFVQLTAAPKDADPFSVKTIRSVNPAFGKFLDEQTVLDEAKRAKRIPAFESAFRNTRLNQRIALETSEQFLTADIWALGEETIDAGLFYDGRPVYGGIDLSARVDLTAFVLACTDDQGCVHLMPFGWTPGDTLERRALRDRVPYDAWVREGLLFAPPGNSIDFEFVAADIARLTQGMNLLAVAYDAWRFDSFQKELLKAGVQLPVVPFKQGFPAMSPAVEIFEAMAVDGKLRHGGHKVLRSCVLSTRLVRDSWANRRPDKTDYFNRIDLAVAAIMAVSTLQASQAAPFDVEALIA